MARGEGSDAPVESKYQFDEVWWKKEARPKGDSADVVSAPNPDELDGCYYTLMTRITVPGFKLDSTDPEDGGYIMFPRIALDGPKVTELLPSFSVFVNASRKHSRSLCFDFFSHSNILSNDLLSYIHVVII